MNYYENDYHNCTRQSEKQLLTIADDILSLYARGEKSRSLSKTKEYLVAFEIYLTGNHIDKTPFGICNDKVQNALKAKIQGDVSAIMVEIDTAVARVRCNLFNNPINNCGYEHNVRFVDWSLRILGITEKTAFNKENQEYLQSPNRNFLPEKEKMYSGRKMMFYRNAYRAEMYSHKLYTSMNQDGQYDMYTPLILSRMAVEQFLKYQYEIKFKSEAPDIASECRKQLEKGNYLTRSFSNELHAVMKRGNLNTHEGYASYVFANIHCNAVLKECFDQM